MSLQANDYVLLVLLGTAAIFDLTRKKIPNFLTLPAIGWGLVSFAINGRLAGLLFSFWGLLLGIAIFLIPFAMGGLGGGDVKLLGAVGALQGAAFVFHAALFTAICGAVLALFYLLAHGKLLPLLKNALGWIVRSLCFLISLRFRSALFAQLGDTFLRPSGEKPGNLPVMPYGVAIALGTLFALTGWVTYF
ncbi:MAG: prepilin peptidase [Bacillota bacterium]